MCRIWYVFGGVLRNVTKEGVEIKLKVSCWVSRLKSHKVRSSVRRKVDPESEELCGTKRMVSSVAACDVFMMRFSLYRLSFDVVWQG